MNDKKVSSWAELVEIVYDGSWKEDICRFRSDYAFRGLSDASYPLKTSLMRLGGIYIKLESALLRNFQKYAGPDAVSVDTVWDWLSLAQHHGLPTRLLDWTYSPLVAMHFATANTNKMGTDGVIWCLPIGEVHGSLPALLAKVRQDAWAHVFTTEMLARAAASLKDFASLSTGHDFLAIFEPPSIDARIVNQYALFSVMSNPQLAIDDWLRAAGVKYQRIIIPASLKWEVRDKLDQANITERMLFPGLDGLSDWLRRHYGQGP